MPNFFVGRSKSNFFGNPYKIGSIVENKKITREDSLRLYKEIKLSNAFYVEKVKEILKGKNLVCWCSLNEECHADLLLKIANEV